MKKIIPYAVVTAMFVCSSGFRSLSADSRAEDIVHEQIERVWSIRQEITELHVFGRQTMGEAMKIMPLGDRAIDPLISYLSWERDWMIRFWIVDLLGYFNSRKVLEILPVIIQDRFEELPVRLKAVESLQKQDTASAYRILTFLARDISAQDVSAKDVSAKDVLSHNAADRKINRKIRKSLKIVKKKR